MQEKKSGDRGVVNSIAELRLKRYMEKGPGAKRPKVPAKPTIEKLRTDVASIQKKPAKSKKRRRK